ncbi:MAG: hypothetical protein ACP5N0_14120 [Methanosarcina sp.]
MGTKKPENNKSDDNYLRYSSRDAHSLPIDNLDIRNYNLKKCKLHISKIIDA